MSSEGTASAPITAARRGPRPVNSVVNAAATCERVNRYASAAPPTRDNKIMVAESQPGGPFFSGRSTAAALLKSSVGGRASGIGASGGSNVSEG